MLIKVILVSNQEDLKKVGAVRLSVFNLLSNLSKREASRVQLFTNSDKSIGTSRCLSLYVCTVTVHDYSLAM